MSAALAVASVMAVSGLLYALLGGADFGGGVLDLSARDPRAKEQRELIEHAIGPVWETNHVWLILLVVLLFTCFAEVFAALSVALFVPIVIMLVSIVLRGAAFVFRAYDRPGGTYLRRWRLLFAASSAAAPLMLGTILGATAQGRLRFVGGVFQGDYLATWLTPFSLLVGVFTLCLFVFLAAVYLTVEAEGELAYDFRRRALVAFCLLLVAAVAVLRYAAIAAPRFYASLVAAPWLFVAALLAAALAALTLWRGHFAHARAAAVALGTLFVAGFAKAQHPYLVFPDFTIAAAAAPARTLKLVLLALAAGAVVLLPSLYLLFYVFKRRRAAR